jgi:hypothetical protein
MWRVANPHVDDWGQLANAASTDVEGVDRRKEGDASRAWAGLPASGVDHGELEAF